MQEAVGMNGNRLLGLANQIHSPPRVRSYAEVLGGVERWARSMQEYEEATKTKVHDASRIAALKKIVPMELAKDLSKLKNLNDYEEARQYILEQVSDHKEQFFGPNPGSGKGPAWQQADMSVMEQSYYEGGYEENSGAGNGGEDKNEDEELNYVKGKGKSGGKGFR